MPESNQKMELLLRAALDADEQELALSPDLSAGYQLSDDSWEVIVRFSESLDALRTEFPDVTITELCRGYAILRLKREQVDPVAQRPEILYMEKPKRLYQEVTDGKIASCITSLQSQAEENNNGQNITRQPDDKEEAVEDRVSIGITDGETESDHLIHEDDSYTGKGVLIAVIDSGIAWWHPDFRNPDGTTRILQLWDQTIAPDAGKGWLPPQGYSNGVLFSAAIINEALGISNISDKDEADTTDEANTADEATANTTFMTMNYGIRTSICPSTDRSGHGTHVTGIAAGNGRASGGQYRGVAYEAELLIVKLGSPDPNGFPNTVELMEAVNFCVQTALEMNRPLCINLSYGNTYGSHSGTSLLETYLDDIALMGRIAIAVGSGNEGADGGHVSGQLADADAERTIAGGMRTNAGYQAMANGGVNNVFISGNRPDSSVQQFAVGDYESSLSIQIWKSVWDEIRFSIISPEGDRAEIMDEVGVQRYTIGKTQIYVYYGEPSPYQIYQEIYLELLPISESYFYLTPGIWSFTMQAQQIRDGRWSMWMPAGAQRGFATQFLLPATDTTLTIPSTATRVITVGAYDAHIMSLAAFSGRGYTWNQQQIKPELVAPGVDIVSCSPGGGYESRSGTSMATPFVTGSCAILMQWGIIEGRDPYLYGEKLKAALIRAARSLPFAATYPNPETGWGALCLRRSLSI